MGTLKSKFEEGILTVFPEGFINSNNAPETDAEMSRLCQEYQPKTVIIDCEALTYISSAGLRVVLRTKQAVPDTHVINVCQDVYEIFEMTGFTEVMDIQKAYRVISVEGCPVIGEGANGKVYRIDPETIVKVYMNPNSLDEIHWQRKMARTAFVLGLPTAIPYDVVKIDTGGYGAVFELLNAESYATLLISGKKTVDEVVDLSIGLLKQIHSRVVQPDQMPDIRESAMEWVTFAKDYISDDQYDRLYALFENVPEDMHMLHGDFHIKNIMLQKEESLLIDMDTLCHGNPIFELAGMFNAYVGYGTVSGKIIENFLGISSETAAELWSKSLRKYLETEDEGFITEVENKASLIGFVRVLRHAVLYDGPDTEFGQATINDCREKITDLLSKVDTLLF